MGFGVLDTVHKWSTKVSVVVVELDREAGQTGRRGPMRPLIS